MELFLQNIETTMEGLTRIRDHVGGRLDRLNWRFAHVGERLQILENELEELERHLQAFKHQQGAHDTEPQVAA